MTTGFPPATADNLLAFLFSGEETEPLAAADDTQPDSTPFKDLLSALASESGPVSNNEFPETGLWPELARETEADGGREPDRKADASALVVETPLPVAWTAPVAPILFVAVPPPAVSSPPMAEPVVSTEPVLPPIPVEDNPVSTTETALIAFGAAAAPTAEAPPLAAASGTPTPAPPAPVPAASAVTPDLRTFPESRGAYRVRTVTGAEAPSYAPRGESATLDLRLQPPPPSRAAFIGKPEVSDAISVLPTRVPSAQVSPVRVPDVAGMLDAAMPDAAISLAPEATINASSEQPPAPVPVETAGFEPVPVTRQECAEPPLPAAPCIESSRPDEVDVDTPAVEQESRKPAEAIPVRKPRLNVEPQEPTRISHTEQPVPAASPATPAAVRPAPPATLPNEPAAAPAAIVSPPVTEEAPARTAPPATDLRYVFEASGREQVGLRVRSVGGAVQVTVQGVDRALRPSLSRELPALVESLQREGWDVAASLSANPKSVVTSAEARPEPAAQNVPSMASDSSFAEQHSGGGRHPQRGREDSPQQPERETSAGRPGQVTHESVFADTLARASRRDSSSPERSLR